MRLSGPLGIGAATVDAEVCGPGALEVSIETPLQQEHFRNNRERQKEPKAKAKANKPKAKGRPKNSHTKDRPKKAKKRTKKGVRTMAKRGQTFIIKVMALTSEAKSTCDPQRLKSMVTRTI